MPNPWARQLAQRRQQAGLSLRRLGHELGVSFSSLARIERGEGLPNTHTRWIVDRWMFPELVREPCLCARCTPTRNESRLQVIEQRLMTLETQIVALQQGLDRALRVTKMHEPMGYCDGEFLSGHKGKGDGTRTGE